LLIGLRPIGRWSVGLHKLNVELQVVVLGREEVAELEIQTEEPGELAHHVHERPWREHPAVDVDVLAGAEVLVGDVEILWPVEELEVVG
jgi:hypothetical protein